MGRAKFLKSVIIGFYEFNRTFEINQKLIIIAVDINLITNGIFIIISILYIIADLTKLHELTLIASFLFLLIVKVHTGKLK